MKTFVADLDTIEAEIRGLDVAADAPLALVLPYDPDALARVYEGEEEIESLDGDIVLYAVGPAALAREIAFTLSR